MPTAKITQFLGTALSPFLGSVLALATSSKGIILSMMLAFLGGGLGWLGKVLVKGLFIYCKDMIKK